MSLITPVSLNRNNIKNICRICLEERSNLISVFASVIFQDECLISISISDVIEKLTSEALHKESQFPTQICVKCVDLLRSAYVFKLKYEESSLLLKQYISTFKDEIESGTPDVEYHQDTYSDSENYVFKSECKKSNKHNNIKSEKKLQNSKKPSRGIILYPCPICTIEFSALELRKHAHTHRALEKYLNVPKTKANAKFFAKPRESTSFFNQSEILHKCPYCSEELPVDQFRLHIDVHRKQDEFKCDKCYRVFRKVNHLNTHRIKHLKEYPYMCGECGKGFVIKTNYDCHILTHTSKELPHECRYCLKRFSNPEHLNRHQIIHTENVSYWEKYRVCKCNHCLKSFKDRDELKSHSCMPVQQISSRKHTCQTCSKVFKYSSGLYNHVRNIHRLKGTKTLCSVCGRYVSNIYNHMMRHNGEKPYQCNQCDKRFGGKPQLRQHLLVHSGLKPFVCSVCAKAFNNLYNLQVHERIHKGDRCHICPICNKGFLEKSYLKKHMNVHKNLN